MGSAKGAGLRTVTPCVAVIVALSYLIAAVLLASLRLASDAGERAHEAQSAADDLDGRVSEVENILDR